MAAESRPPNVLLLLTTCDAGPAVDPPSDHHPFQGAFKVLAPLARLFN